MQDILLAMAFSINNELQRLRLSYDLYGFVKLTNTLESWQVNALEEGFNRIYEKETGSHPDEAAERLPALNMGIESDFEFMKIIASLSYVYEAMDAIAGHDSQYIATDILCIYDDSIGTHRDTYYDCDVPKALIFLSDCNSKGISVSEAYYTRNLAGSFAVLSGSHLPNSLYSTLTAQLTDWPDPSQTLRTALTPHYMRGDKKKNGDNFYAALDYDSRYQGFSYIPFKRGDIVIFSTRALHALLPTHSEHFSKLIGVLFLEGFTKFAARQLPNEVMSMTDLEMSYLAIPYNLRLADLLVKGADFDSITQDQEQKYMGLAQQISQGDPLFNSVFEPKTMIYRMFAEHSDLIKYRVSSDAESVFRVFQSNVNHQRDELQRYYAKINLHELETIIEPNHQRDTLIASLRDEFFSGHQEIEQFQAIVDDRQNKAAKRWRDRLKNIYKGVFG